MNENQLQEMVELMMQSTRPHILLALLECCLQKQVEEAQDESFRSSEL